ncbi:MAG TPA: F0F1 ATP synthase subunit B [Gemmatimonadaceae bacterium]|jgi:F-type H+-transporting ATPase subunit b|nr:F0F1 ATP synthase subunit B [Gemmatimonadaceae bacterium]
MTTLFFALLQHTTIEEATPKVNLLSPNGGLMFWTLVVFVILFVILGRFVFPKITAAVEAREKALEDAIEGAKRDREEAARALAEQLKGIEAARLDAQKIIVEGRQTGEKLRAQMIEETHAQQQQMLERARREIEQEKEKAIAELRREAIELAIAGASKVIEKNLDDASNRKIVESFLASIPVSEKKRG